MWTRVFTAILCLLAFLTEITFDSSTSFVRVNAAAVNSTLAITNPPFEKKQPTPNTPIDNQSDEGSNDPEQSNDEPPNGASHAGNIPSLASLSVLVPIARLVVYSDPPYSEPRLSNPQRPPSA